MIRYSMYSLWVRAKRYTWDRWTRVQHVVAYELIDMGPILKSPCTLKAYLFLFGLFFAIFFDLDHCCLHLVVNGHL